MSKQKNKIVRPSAEETAEFAPSSEAFSPEGASTEEPVTHGTPGEETVEALRTERDAYKDKLLRAQAECANTSKRLHQQHVEAQKYAGIELARSLLPVLDSFERMLDSLGESVADDPVRQGVQLIADQLAKTLKDHGVERIEALGRPFDPKYHEAVMQDRESGAAPGTVTRELDRGYRMHERVLRPAKVAVAAEAQEDAPEADEKAGKAGAESAPKPA